MVIETLNNLISHYLYGAPGAAEHHPRDIGTQYNPDV